MNKRIKELRKALKLTQQGFANALNISKSTIEAYEYRNVTVTDRTVNDICRVFHVNEDWLRSGEGEMFLAPTREDEIAEMTARMFKADDSDYWYQLGKILKDVDDEHMEALFNIAKEWVEEVTKAKQAKEDAAAPADEK
jgi:transcriptional regulator with XRE-family HTH domain